jgi:hypothetical protein
MTVVYSHHVVGLIDISHDAPSSADAIVRECLGIRRPQSRERWDFASRLQPVQLAPVKADFSQLRDDLDQLLETFLLDSQD